MFWDLFKTKSKKATRKKKATAAKSTKAHKHAVKHTAKRAKRKARAH